MSFYLRNRTPTPPPSGASASYSPSSSSSSSPPSSPSKQDTPPLLVLSAGTVQAVARVPDLRGAVLPRPAPAAAAPAPFRSGATHLKSQTKTQEPDQEATPRAAAGEPRSCTPSQTNDIGNLLTKLCKYRTLTNGPESIGIGIDLGIIGSRIKGVHPFSWVAIAYQRSRDEMETILSAPQDDTTRTRVIEGIKNSCTREGNNLDQYIPWLATKVSKSEADVRRFIDSKNIEGLLTHIFSAPRPALAAVAPIRVAAPLSQPHQPSAPAAAAAAAAPIRVAAPLSQPHQPSAPAAAAAAAPLLQLHQASAAAEQAIEAFLKLIHNLPLAERHQYLSSKEFSNLNKLVRGLPGAFDAIAARAVREGNMEKRSKPILEAFMSRNG